MKKSVNLIIIMLLSVLMFSCGSTGNKKETLKIKISPSSQTVAVGDEISYLVKVENVKDLFAVSLEIVFNGSFVELPENALTVGSVWGNEVISTSVQEIDRLNVAIGFMQGNSNDELEGDVTLFEFTIKGKAAGESDLFIYNLTMIDDDGEDIEDFAEIEIAGSSVTVQ
ncbi:MAG: cohesin domain-containing protein [Candidatus Cloacimonadales bacterium]|nr:cohesin domain-containing protein [Candidatus Cloacimonadales bacterium]